MTTNFLFRSLFALSAAITAQGAIAQEAEPEDATIEWSHARCEYILIKKASGHGIITQFSAERLKPGDVISSDFRHSVNSGKIFTNKATGETGMLRGAAFDLTRSQALKKIQGICKKHAPQE